MKAFLPKTIAALMIIGVTSFWEGAGAWAQTSSNAGIVRPEYADQSTTTGCSSQGCDSACSQQERATFGDWLWPSNYGCPYWSVTAEATAMQRSAPRNQPLFRQTLSQTDQLNAKDLNFPVSMGFQLSAIRHNVGGSGWDLEVAYAQMDGFETDSDIAEASRMILDRNNASWTVRDAEARYSSALYNGEINAHYQEDWLTFLVGFRMGQLSEHYSGLGSDISTELIDSVRTDTHNHFYGIQIGALGEVYNDGGPLTINAFCKAGAYDNVAQQHYQLASGGDVYDLRMGHRDQAMFLGEVGVKATYSVTKRLAVHASAEAMWLSGVALAPDQIRAVDLVNDTTSIDTFGTAFYYGGGLGIEYRF
ncbi:MAG: hypothetical protein ABFC77_08320 [Thermoguttaceae bacterium]